MDDKKEKELLELLSEKKFNDIYTKNWYRVHECVAVMEEDINKPYAPGFHTRS